MSNESDNNMIVEVIDGDGNTIIEKPKSDQDKDEKSK